MKITVHIMFAALLILSMLAGSCKKDPDNTAAVSTDKMAGTYKGSMQHWYKNVTASGTFADTTAYPDTSFVITKVVPDSFMLSNPDWEITQPAFYFDASGRYFRKRGTPAFNDHMEELTIRFNVTYDSVYILRHYVMVSSNVLDIWDEFNGKK